MASSSSSSHSNHHHTEPAKIEQIITEFFAKSLHIILESRSPCGSSRNYCGEQTLSSPSSSASSSSSIRPRDKWFNLALRECPEALENLDLWHHSNFEPMVVDVILIQRPVNFDSLPTSPNTGLVRNLDSKERFSSDCWDSGKDEMNRERIIERWVVQYESRKSKDSSSGNKRSGGYSSSSLYKKSIILLRSLYLTVKLLPAYKLFRDLNSSGQILEYTLAHRVSSFVEPFTRREDLDMQQFGFTPVDTSCGRLCLFVSYCPRLSDVNSEPMPPMSPHFIPDYVGSPTTDPLRRLTSLPLTRFRSQGSSSPGSFERRHSWSYDTYRGYAPPVSPSPSPTYSGSRFVVSNPNFHCLPPLSIPSHPLETPRSSNASLATKNSSFDEFWPSPMFSASPSPSPPNHFNGVHSSKALLRSESAPLSIPSRSPAALSNVLPLSPPRGTGPGPIKTKDVKSKTRPMDVSPHLELDKTNTFVKNEVGNLHVMEISSSITPKNCFSRRSSRLPSQDMFDYLDFACPFAVEQDDVTDPRPGPELFEGLATKKSKDAAVGALVEILNTAPPLRQDIANLIKLSPSSGPETRREIVHDPRESLEHGVRGGIQVPASVTNLKASSGHLLLKTTAEALKEFQNYKEMKESLLRKGGEPQTSADKGGY